MDTAKILEILRITLPVFALLGLGNVLSRAGKMTEAHQSFLNWLVYYISLPALIFAGMAAQPFSGLLNTDFILATLLAMLAVFLIFTVITAVLRLDRKFAIVVIFSTYWSNVAYMGFPLTESAFGERGFLFAAIVNAVSMPVFVAVTFLMIGLFAGDRGRGGVLKSLRGALINPIILASIAGLLWSWGADVLGFGGGWAGVNPAPTGDGMAPVANPHGDDTPVGATLAVARNLPAVVREAFGIMETIMKNVGTMGLSLALLSIGGKLRFRSFGKNALPLSLAVTGKLIILPLLTLAIMRVFFPLSPKDVVGSAVLLMTMPTAVAAVIIAGKFGLNEEFVSSVLAVSMIGGVVMIPVWLYVVL